jgi:hypothetical protein
MIYGFDEQRKNGFGILLGAAPAAGGSAFPPIAPSRRKTDGAALSP